MMSNILLCFAILSLLGGTSRGDSVLQKFYIGGLFPNDAKDEHVRNSLGVYPEIAAALAVRHVQESGLLTPHNISLEMLSFGTSCMKDSAVYAYLQLTQAIEIKTESSISEFMHVKTVITLALDLVKPASGKKKVIKL